MAVSQKIVGENALTLFWNAINTKLNLKSDKTHTHNYAGSSSAGGSATSAVKLDTTTAGSATQPCYFTNGKPSACTYTLGKSVPSDAKFTDTVYSLPTASSSTLGGVKIGSGISISSGVISASASSVGAAASSHTHSYITDGTMAIYGEASNEINFGGSGSASDVYFGYRAKDSKPKPSTYHFGNNDASVYAGAVYGAVWNDYAEFRKANTTTPGKCIVENGDDSLSESTQRLQRGAAIISDTFGFSIGETDESKTPVAVAGRVLAYGYESREEFKNHIGYAVCSGPNGTVSIMTEEEERNHPGCVIGYISAVPDYEEWGTGKVKVNDRIWIKVK